MEDREETRYRRERAARQRVMALAMRREGLSVDAIASRLGVTRAGARRILRQEVRLMRIESEADELRTVHSEALMELWRAVYPAAVTGDMDAIDRFLRIEERLSRLHGLDSGADATSRETRGDEDHADPDADVVRPLVGRRFVPASAEAPVGEE